jgi:hypothetical protein
MASKPEVDEVEQHCDKNYVCLGNATEDTRQRQDDYSLDGADEDSQK